MAIVMNLRWKGVTPAQYDRACELVGWEVDHPQGGRYHVAWFDDEGLRVTDIWDSAEEFEAFVQSRLMPGVAEAGIEGEPEVEVVPAHRTFEPYAS
jgi:hypothetical protein